MATWGLKKMGGKFETPPAKKRKHTASPTCHTDKLASGCGCACDTDLWWKEGDGLLSQTMKRRRSRAYKRAYKEKTEQLRAEGLEEAEIRKRAGDYARIAWRQVGLSCLLVEDKDMR